MRSFVAVAAGSVIGALLAWPPAGVAARAPLGCEVPAVTVPASRVQTDQPKVSVTFDEPLGPQTRRILRILGDYGMRSTFFAVGSEVESHLRATRAVLAHGSELANHSYTHSDLTAQGDSGRSELMRTNAALSRIAGFRPCLFRPPMALWDDGVVAAASGLDLTTVLWDRGGADPFTTDPDAIAAKALDGIAPGSIVLLHQFPHSVQALPKILTGLRERGLRSVPVVKLLGGRFLRRPAQGRG